jgi:predicted dehydrogenase
MDIMTERHEIGARILHALMQREDLFGTLQTAGDQPALSLQSVHYLYKLVNRRPLVRPAWYFDVQAQGEGVTDVNTHLVDLAQWITGAGRAFDFERDVELLSARQWPTGVPRDMFRQITGLEDFPDTLRGQVRDGTLHYLCNAAVSYRLRGVPVQVEALWGLAIPQGGGDTHRIDARGTRAQIAVRLDATSAFRTEVTVQPVHPHAGFAQALSAAVASMQAAFPGLEAEAAGSAFRVAIPDALRTTHEEHFAMVLDAFIGYADSGQWPANLGPDLVTKYTLLTRAKALSHTLGDPR